MAAVELHRAAVAEAAHAAAWYRREASEDVAVRFHHALAEALHKISSAPMRWPVTAAGARRVRVVGFPYFVVYGLIADRAVVLAVAHERRRPGYWRRRRTSP